MKLIGVFLLFLILGIVPLFIGLIPADCITDKRNSIAFRWVCGFLLMWAGFQIICVPLILTEGMGETHFPLVVACYSFYLILSSAIGVFIYYKNPTRMIKVITQRTKQEKILLGTALLLIGLQIVLSVVLVYADGDDAYYVAVSTITESSDTMYKIAPYSVGNLELDARHSLAPFPIWIAYLSRISGLNAALVAHSVVAPVLIALTYVIYYLLGREIFGRDKEKLLFFLNMVAFLVLFGDYSSYTVENFMLARSRQGKAALGNILIPVLFYLMFLFLNRIKEAKKIEWMMWVLLCCAVIASCLCTTLGSFLACLLIAVVGICTGLSFKRVDVVWKLAICCCPAVLFAVLYMGIG